MTTNGGVMAYRGTREQDDTRKAALLAEIEAVDQQIRIEAGYLESRRRQRWGPLGGLWSRICARSPKPAVEQRVDVLSRLLLVREGKLSRLRGRVRRYDEALAKRIARSEGARTRASGRAHRRIDVGSLLDRAKALGRSRDGYGVPLLMVMWTITLSAWSSLISADLVEVDDYTEFLLFAIAFGGPVAVMVVLLLVQVWRDVVGRTDKRRR